MAVEVLLPMMQDEAPVVIQPRFRGVRSLEVRITGLGSMAYSNPNISHVKSIVWNKPLILTITPTYWRYKLFTHGVYWGNNPFILTFDPRLPGTSK